MYSVSSRNALLREQNRERPALTEGTHDILLRFPPSTRTKSREDPRKNEVFLWDCLIKCVPTSFFFLFRLHKKKKKTHTHTQTYTHAEKQHIMAPYSSSVKGLHNFKKVQ